MGCHSLVGHMNIQPKTPFCSCPSNSSWGWLYDQLLNSRMKMEVICVISGSFPYRKRICTTFLSSPLCWLESWYVSVEQKSSTWGGGCVTRMSEQEDLRSRDPWWLSSPIPALDHLSSFCMREKSTSILSMSPLFWISLLHQANW